MHDTIGVDISKDTLDIHRLSDGKHIRFGNDKAGLAALRRWIGKTRVRVVYESTGRYHRDMEGVLDTAGHALVKVNPGRARRFAQAAGYGAKTDRVDAAMLARMGAVLDLDARPVRSDCMHEIRELHVARIGLVKDRTACRNRLHGARNKIVLTQLRARLRQVETQIEQIDAELHRLINLTLDRLEQSRSDDYDGVTRLQYAAWLADRQALLPRLRRARASRRTAAGPAQGSGCAHQVRARDVGLEVVVPHPAAVGRDGVVVPTGGVGGEAVRVRAVARKRVAVLGRRGHRVRVGVRVGADGRLSFVKYPS